MPIVESNKRLPVILIAENTNRHPIASDISHGVDFFANGLKEIAKQNIKYDDYTYLDYWVLFYSLGSCAQKGGQGFVSIEDLDTNDLILDDSVNLNNLYYALDSELSEFPCDGLKPQIVFFVDSTLRHFHNPNLCQSLLKNYKFSQSQIYVCCFGDSTSGELDVFAQFVPQENIKTIKCNADLESILKKVSLKCEPLFGFDGTIEQYRRYRQYTVRKTLIEMLQAEEAQRLIDEYENDKKGIVEKTISDGFVEDNWSEDW